MAITDYELLLDLVRDNGMDAKISKMFIKNLSDDENAFQTDDETKRWALQRGFYPGRVELLSLNEGNYNDYMPDYSYFMIHPINHHFRIWVNDKLTLKYVLNNNVLKDSMPEYYLYVENSSDYTYLMDAPASIKKDNDFILNLLKEKGCLAVKPNSGTSGGIGFMKMEWVDGNIHVNNKIIDTIQFNEILSQLQNNIVTEYSHQHLELAKIWPESECTLRVIMIKLPSEDNYYVAKWHNIVSYARFGSSVSGGASNLSSGGIGVGFDYKTGQFKNFGARYKKFCPDGEYISYEHPDTYAVWKDFKLPNWEYVKAITNSVCQYIGSLDYLGFDVIITPDGLKYCEINTQPEACFAQIMCGPILSNENAKRFFKYHGLYKVNNEEFYEMYMKSQK